MKKKFGLKLVMILFFLCFIFLCFQIGEFNRNHLLLIALFFEIFLTFPMSLRFFYPLSKLIAGKQSLNLFWLLFVARAAFLLLFTFFVSATVFVFDFLFFIAAVFLLLPFVERKTSSLKKGEGKEIYRAFRESFLRNNPNERNLLIRCAKCGKTLKITDQVCPNCGAPFYGNNVTVELKQEGTHESLPKEVVYKEQFDSIYQLSEEEMLEEFIRRKMMKTKIDPTGKKLPKEIVQGKKFTYLLFSISLFTFVSLFFFHLSLFVYVFGSFFFLFFFMDGKFDWMDYFKEQIQLRPGENVSFMMMDIKKTCVFDSSWKYLLIGILLSIVLPLLLFAKPRIFYERVDQGYAVRFYTIGLVNATKITIPESYREKPVVELKDGVFSNMYFLKEVRLPDTILRIGQYAFKNDSSLEKIALPDSVTQIGSSAFDECVHLKTVSISKDSSLETIGPLAFSSCYRLDTIELPEGVEVDAAAFYKSPTKIQFYRFSSFPKTK